MPSEVHNVLRWTVDHGQVDPVNMQIGEGDLQDWVVHMAAVACLSACQLHTAMTMMTPEQVCHTSFISGMHHYECVVTDVDIKLKSGQF